MSLSGWIEESLLSLLRDAPPGAEEEWVQRLGDASAVTQLTQAAESHGILGYAHAYLSRLRDLDEGALEDLRARYRAAFRRHLAAIADLTRLVTVLQGIEGSWLVLEGPILPETVYPRPDLRSYDAVDLLVREEILPDFLHLVQTAGSLNVDPEHGPDASAQGGVQLLLWHQSLTRAWTGPSRYGWNVSLPFHETFADSILVSLQGSSVRTLDPATALIDLALRSEGESPRHLGRLKDAERILTARRPEWSELVERSRDWRAERAVLRLLQAVRSSLGHPITERVLSALGRAEKTRPARKTAWRIAPPPRTSGFSDVEAALLALLEPSPRSPGLLPPAAWKQILALAESERLTPLVTNAVEGLGLRVPVEVGAALSQSRRHAGAVAALAFQRVAPVLTGLRAHGMRTPIVLKGGALARWIYADPSLRPFTDIDLLVPAVDVSPTHDLLTELGYRLGTGQPTTLTDLTWRHARGYYDPSGNRPTLDVHWRLAGYPFLIGVNYETFVKRCTIERVEGADLLVPSPSDALVISSIYFLRELWYGKPRLRYVRDVAEIIARHPIDWHTVDGLAHSVRYLRAPLLLSLSAAQRLFRTPVRPILETMNGQHSSLLRVLVDRTCARILGPQHPAEVLLLNLGFRWLDNPSLLGLAGWLRSLIFVPRGLGSSQRRWLRRLVRG